MRRLGIMAGLVLLLAAVPAEAQSTTPDYLAWAQPGPYLTADVSQVTSFSSSQPIVGTYFFYWFDATYLNGRQLGFDPFPFHPVDQASQSFSDPAWYVRQFSDMLDAGIDFVLPDYWGEPGQYNRRVAPAPELNLFATQGLPPMVEALGQLEESGRSLKVALFLDTTILNDEDLTTQRGKDIFYTTIRDFYSRIPARYWAAIDGRPIVWL
jgi:hypothetical protein